MQSAVVPFGDRSAAFDLISAIEIMDVVDHAIGGMDVAGQSDTRVAVGNGFKLISIGLCRP